MYVYIYAAEEQKDKFINAFYKIKLYYKLQEDNK